MAGQDRSKLKWVCYAALLLALLVLERCVCGRFPLWGTIPRLVSLLAAAVGFWEGSAAGAVFGLCAGLLCALTPGGEGAALIWQNTVIGLLCGTTRDKALGRGFLGYLLCALACLLFLEGLQVLGRVLFLRQNAGAVFRIAGKEGGGSLLCAIPVYLAARAVSRRFSAELEF